MPTGKQQYRKMLKDEKSKKAMERKETKDKRSDKDQLKILDSKGLIATKERTKIENRIKEQKGTK